MRWQEIKESAEQYKQDQAEEARLQRAAEAERTLRSEQDRVAKENATQSEAEERLAKFNVREVLEAIRDDVWKEGEVTSYRKGLDTSDPTRGLQLLSEPYQVVSLSGTGRDLSARLVQQRAALVVYSFKDRSGPGGSLGAYGHYVYNVEDGRKEGVVEKIEELGLEEGLKKAAVLKSREVHYNSSGISLDSSQGAFDNLITGHVAHRQRYRSNPAQVREWTNSIIGELPAQLRENAIISSGELREWGHQVRGSSGLYRVTDRAFGKIGIGLKV